MKRHRVRPDGNCLFASCGYHLQMKPCCLRTQVAQVIRDHPTMTVSDKPLLDWIEMAGHDPKSYAHQMARPGVMGTGIELAIISILSRRSIRVYRAQSQQLERIAEYFPEFGRPISLLFSGPASGGHYDALVED